MADSFQRRIERTREGVLLYFVYVFIIPQSLSSVAKREAGQGYRRMKKMQDLLALSVFSFENGSMLESKPEYGVSRATATLAVMRNDLQEDIEGEDIIGETIYGIRNVLAAGVHGIQGIIPSIANSVNNQKYDVIPREGPLHGTSNAVKKIFETKGVLGKASAIFAEAPDGVTDDLMHTVGASEWVIEPSYNTAA